MGDVEDGDRPDEPFELARVPMAVEDEVRRVLGDRAGEPVAAEECPDALRLPFEGRARRRVMKEDDSEGAIRYPIESPLESLHLRGRLRIDPPQHRLAEIRQSGIGEAADESFRPDDPDARPVQVADRPVPLEHGDPGIFEKSHDLVAPVRVPVVISEDSDDRHRQSAAGAGEDSRFVGLAVGRQVAGEENEVGFLGDTAERRLDLSLPIRRAMNVPSGRDPDQFGSPPGVAGYRPARMANEDFEAMMDTLKKSAAALRDAGVPFMLGGGLAAWARGGPESNHDLDLMLKPEDADTALDVLAEAGMRPERPPEGWLYKAWDENHVMVDLIFEPTGLSITDETFERAEDMEVEAVSMKVMSLEDVFVTKLLAMDEQSLDYKPVLQMARSLREQIDWDDVRARTPSPYAAAFFTLAEELGILSPSSG
jgi:predicted nucleotidyltransferase